jgi:glucan phosphoethanolaminetransferase (alkaline phosphatase superfamily)
MNSSQAFLRDMSQPEYVHVLINPLPVYGFAMGVLALLIALMLRSRRAQIIALVLIILTALSAWPVFVYGEKSYQRVHAIADKDGQAWLEAHMHRAERLIYVYYVTAALGLLAIFIPFRWPRMATPFAGLTLILAIGLLGVGSYIAYAGGKVRHREFRNEPPPGHQT